MAYVVSTIFISDARNCFIDALWNEKPTTESIYGASFWCICHGINVQSTTLG